jgi:phosphate uptake regulator
MKRKIIKQGAGGCTIFLPIKWVRKNSLYSGKEVEVTELDNNLIVSSPEKKNEKIKRVLLENGDSNSQINLLIGSTYRAGYSSTIVSFNQKTSLSNISEIVNNYTGLEITNQTVNEITIKSFLNNEKEEVENLIVKMFQITNTIVNEIDIEWEKIDFKKLEIMKNNIIKVGEHTLRTIHLNNYGEEKSYDYYDLVTQIQKISSDLTNLCNYYYKEKIEKTTLINKLKTKFGDIYHSYLKKNFQESSEVWITQYSELHEDFSPDKFNELIKVNDPIMVLYYHKIIERYSNIASRILSISI